ncbi:dicarboxylate/amino acid:cation symporter [bacterium]|jgi:proton glutamate symport protein|nr:dicarboxylate/amino acid:cation symporter [bacterium]
MNRLPHRWPLHWQIISALFLGLGTGLMLGADHISIPVFGFAGDLFLRALRMVIVPLIASSIITGVAGLGSSKSIGRLFTRTFGWYMLTSLLAILLGLLLVNAFQPGIADGVPVGEKLGLSQLDPGTEAKLSGRGASDLTGILMRMIPENPVGAAAEGKILPLIVFCLLIGAALTALPEKIRDPQYHFWGSLFHVMMKITGWVIRLAPIGIFGLITKMTATNGLEALGPLAKYAAIVLAALLGHALITLPLLLWFTSRINPIKHYKAMLPALVTAFSTQSSSATLPLTMKCVEEEVGVSNRVSSFVLPLGATVNMDGTALYECIAALFIAQAYGVNLGPLDQFLVVMTALLASIGAAGIPAAGLVMIAIILDTVGLPLEGVGLILAIDPLLDMCRTSVNVFSDSCGAAVVAVKEGETGLYKN